jgi:hypothetical protein
MIKSIRKKVNTHPFTATRDAGIVYIVISVIFAAIDPKFWDITDIYAAGLTPFLLTVDSFVISLLVNRVIRRIIFLNENLIMVSYNSVMSIIRRI